MIVDRLVTLIVVLRPLNMWELYIAVDCWIGLNRVVTLKDTVVRTSGAGFKEFRNRRFSGVPSLVLIQNWWFSAAWSSCNASVVPSTATFSCPEYDIDSRFSTLDYRFLLVQGFGNGTSTKTITGKPFSRRRVKWWLLVRYLSDARSRRGGGGVSAYERGWDARRKFWIKPLKETDLGVAQAFFDP